MGGFWTDLDSDWDSSCLWHLSRSVLRAGVMRGDGRSLSPIAEVFWVCRCLQYALAAVCPCCPRLFCLCGRHRLPHAKLKYCYLGSVYKLSPNWLLLSKTVAKS